MCAGMDVITLPVQPSFSPVIVSITARVILWVAKKLDRYFWIVSHCTCLVSRHTVGLRRSFAAYTRPAHQGGVARVWGSKQSLLSCLLLSSVTGTAEIIHLSKEKVQYIPLDREKVFIESSFPFDCFNLNTKTSRMPGEPDEVATSPIPVPCSIPCSSSAHTV